MSTPSFLQLTVMLWTATYWSMTSPTERASRYCRVRLLFVLPVLYPFTVPLCSLLHPASQPFNNHPLTCVPLCTLCIQCTPGVYPVCTTCVPCVPRVYLVYPLCAPCVPRVYHVCTLCTLCVPLSVPCVYPLCSVYPVSLTTAARCAR